MLAIRFYDKSKSKPIGLFLVLLTSFAGELLHVDYGMLGVLLIAIFYILRAHKMIMMLVASLILVISRLTIVPAFEPFYYPLIVEQLEKYAKAKGIAFMNTAASVTSQRFFEKQGYVLLQEQIVERRGVRMRRYLMEKKL